MNVLVSYKKFEVSIDEFGFYLLHIFKNEEITLEDVDILILAQKKICGKKRPTLVICDEFSTTSADVLKFISQNQNVPYSSAGAFVLNSIAQKLLANFYLKFTHPQRPTKFFNNKNDAIEWLKQYL